jgi:SpoVK/Ycf46/Vps4 family AAA+-type ATPase
MLSRLDLSIKFELPDELSRAAIFYRYAKHLNDQDRKKLAEFT